MNTILSLTMAFLMTAMVLTPQLGIASDNSSIFVELMIPLESSQHTEHDDLTHFGVAVRMRNSSLDLHTAHWWGRHSTSVIGAGLVLDTLQDGSEGLYGAWVPGLAYIVTPDDRLLSNIQLYNRLEVGYIVSNRIGLTTAANRYGLHSNHSESWISLGVGHGKFGVESHQPPTSTIGAHNYASDSTGGEENPLVDSSSNNTDNPSSDGILGLDESTTPQDTQDQFDLGEVPRFDGSEGAPNPSTDDWGSGNGWWQPGANSWNHNDNGVPPYNPYYQPQGQQHYPW